MLLKVVAGWFEGRSVFKAFKLWEKDLVQMDAYPAGYLMKRRPPPLSSSASRSRPEVPGAGVLGWPLLTLSSEVHVSLLWRGPAKWELRMRTYEGAAGSW